MSQNPLEAMVAAMLHRAVQVSLDAGDSPEEHYESVVELYNVGLQAPLPLASRAVGYEKTTVAAGSLEFTRHTFTLERENEYAPERPPTFTIISGPTEATCYECANII